jgi:pimeloyl-ACP methyl ester carboxylesterase
MTAGVRRQALTIPSGREGVPMHCIISSPERPPARPSVLIFSQAGLQNKGGVGDYFRWLADELAVRGHHVLRFDQPGTGDSPGELLQDEPLENYFVEVQKGISTDDTAAALEWAHQAWPGARVFLWGQCGGCIPSLEAAARLPDMVSGLILLAVPVLYSQALDTVREADARVAAQGYLYKLRNPQAYLRLLSGKSEYRLIWASLRSVVRRARRKITRKLEDLRPQAQPDHPKFNTQLWEALQEVMASRLPTLFLMAEIDNETPEFEEEFKLKVLDKRPAWQTLCDVQTLEQADHSLMFPEARERSLRAQVAWLAKVGPQ